MNRKYDLTQRLSHQDVPIQTAALPSPALVRGRGTGGEGGAVQNPPLLPLGRRWNTVQRTTVPPYTQWYHAPVKIHSVSHRVACNSYTTTPSVLMTRCGW